VPQAPIDLYRASNTCTTTLSSFYCTTAMPSGTSRCHPSSHPSITSFRSVSASTASSSSTSSNHSPLTCNPSQSPSSSPSIEHHSLASVSRAETHTSLFDRPFRSSADGSASPSPNHLDPIYQSTYLSIPSLDLDTRSSTPSTLSIAHSYAPLLPHTD